MYAFSFHDEFVQSSIQYKINNTIINSYKHNMVHLTEYV